MIDLVYGPDSATFIMIHYVMLLYYVLNKHEYISGYDPTSQMDTITKDRVGRLGSGVRVNASFYIDPFYFVLLWPHFHTMTPVCDGAPLRWRTRIYIS